MNDEVTVYGELAGDELNKDSFWATVIDVSRAKEDFYEVADAQNKKHIIKRSLLRHCNWHSACGNWSHHR